MKRNSVRYYYAEMCEPFSSKKHVWWWNVHNTKFSTSRMKQLQTNDRCRSNTKLPRVVPRRRSTPSTHWFILLARHYNINNNKKKPQSTALVSHPFCIIYIYYIYIIYICNTMKFSTNKVLNIINKQ